MSLLGRLVSTDDRLAAILGYASGDEFRVLRGDLPMLGSSCLIRLMESYLERGRIGGVAAELAHALGGTVAVVMDGRLVTMESGDTAIELRIQKADSSIAGGVEVGNRRAAPA